MRIVWRKYGLWLILLSLIFAIHIFKGPRVFWKTLAAYTNLVVTEGAWRPLQLITRSPVKEDVQIKFDERALATDIYIPRPWIPAFAGMTKKEFPGLLLFTPLVAEGRRDKRITNLAETFSRLGFVVAVPDRPPREGTAISERDIKDAREAWQYLKTRADVRDDRVAVFGLSYGFGPVFLAANEDQDMKEFVPFVAGFGGYADLKEVLRYALTGHYEYQDIKDFREPDPWLRDIAKENVRNMLPTSTAREKFLQNTDPESFDALYGELPKTFRDTINKFSPASVIKEYTRPLVLIHSTDDNVIPFTESLRLRDLATASTQISLALVSIFRHGDYKPLTRENIFENYLPSFNDSFRFLYNFLML